MKVLLVIGLCSVVFAGCAEAEELSPNAFSHFDGGSFTVTSGTTTTGTTSTGSTTSSTTNGPSTSSSTTTTSTSTGTTGAGGSGGTASGSSTGGNGGGGAGGASGSGGSGGSSNMTDAGFIAGLQVLYLNMQTGSSSPYIGCELHAKNGGQSTAPIDELKVRYYFTNDISLPPQIMFNWSHVSTPG